MAHSYHIYIIFIYHMCASVYTLKQGEPEGGQTHIISNMNHIRGV